MKLVVVGVMAAASMAIGAPAASAGRIGPNHVPYWGEDCVKIDHGVGGDGATLVVDRAYRLVVLKSATNHDTFFAVRPGDRLTTGTGQGISHYILCTAAEVTSTPTTTTTTAPTTTTTALVPATTTTTTALVPATTTTTVVPSTTTVPDAEPAAVVPTTTTTVVPSTTTPVVPTTTTVSAGTVPTSTVPTSTVPTSTVPTTTVPDTEPTDLTSAPSTSIPDPSSTPSTTPPDGDRPVAQPTPAESTPRLGASTDFKLAVTGMNLLGILVLAVGLIGLGLVMVTARRRAEPDVAGHTAD